MPSSQQQMQSSSSFTSTSFSTFTSSSSSSSSHSHNGGAPVTQTYTERASFNDRDGGRVERTHSETGQPSWHETTRLDAQGRALGTHRHEHAGNRIEDVSDAHDKDAAARRYEENIEDEYAKREGGA